MAISGSHFGSSWGIVLFPACLWAFFIQQQKGKARIEWARYVNLPNKESLGMKCNIRNHLLTYWECVNLLLQTVKLLAGWMTLENYFIFLPVFPALNYKTVMMTHTLPSSNTNSKHFMSMHVWSNWIASWMYLSFFLVTFPQRTWKKFSGMSLKYLFKGKVKYKANKHILFQTRQRFVSGHCVYLSTHIGHSAE